MKKFIRQWLCEHKKQTTLKKVETAEYLANLVKKPNWFPPTILTFQVWNRCSDCGKVLTYKYKR